ncbi:MAG: hypothetical protein A2Y73_00245 [Chloroflexi bacterium RBG_13_56_8]|nr:MAG: hypothetical protein A2Y73_00245 [Chloroflexi bacterium RBG_13_56_8]
MTQEEIIAAAEELAVDGELACVDAHALAERMGISPREVGRAVNRTETRFSRCQLGLFGYGPKAEGKSKIILKAAHVPEDIGAILRARSVDGRIACLAAWEIADQFKYPRLGIANIIEALGLKVTPCQLGCF